MTQVHSPRQLLPFGVVLTNQDKFDVGPGFIDDLQLCVLCAQLGLYPSRMSRIYLDIGGLQLGSQMNRELIQRSLRCVVCEGLNGVMGLPGIASRV